MAAEVDHGIYALTTEGAHNGTGAPPDAPALVRCRLDRVVVQIVVAREQNGRKTGETAFNAVTLFADPEPDSQSLTIRQLKTDAAHLAFQCGKGEIVTLDLMSLLGQLQNLKEQPMPWGAALEKLIAPAVAQAEGQG